MKIFKHHLFREREDIKRAGSTNVNAYSSLHFAITTWIDVKGKKEERSEKKNTE